MFLNTFSDESNPLLNSVQLVVSEVLIFHENLYMFPFGDPYEISPGVNDPTESITLVPVGLPIINQLG